MTAGAAATAAATATRSETRRSLPPYCKPAGGAASPRKLEQRQSRKARDASPGPFDYSVRFGDQAVKLAGSTFTPGPMVDESEMRLT